MMKSHALDVCAELAEGMEEAVALCAPVVELDAEFKAGPGGADKLALVDAEHFVEELQRGDGGFAYADGADVVGLDKGDGVRAFEGLRHGRRAHPAGGAASDDPEE